MTIVPVPRPTAWVTANTVIATPRLPPNAVTPTNADVATNVDRGTNAGTPPTSRAATTTRPTTNARAATAVLEPIVFTNVITPPPAPMLFTARSIRLKYKCKGDRYETNKGKNCRFTLSESRTAVYCLYCRKGHTHPFKRIHGGEEPMEEIGDWED